MCILEYMHNWLNKEKLIQMCNAVKKFSIQLIVWWFWWTRAFILQAMYCTGALILQLYNVYLRYVDTDYKPLQSKCNRLIKRKRKQNRCGLLTMAGCFCTFSDGCNTYGRELVLLRQPVMYCKAMWFNKMIEIWDLKRNEVGSYPPHGWPLSMLMFIIACALC